MSFDNSGWKQQNGGNGNWKSGSGNNGGGGNWKQNNNKGEWKPDDTPPEPLAPYIPFAILGDNETPNEIINQMAQIVEELASDGFTPRTGCDNPIAAMVSAKVPSAEIYVPWSGFGGQETFYAKTNMMIQRVACHFAPYLITAKRAARVIQSYYLMLLLGKDSTSHSRFFITWSPKGEETYEGVTRETGNMGLLIKVANSLNIPIFNLANDDALDKCKRYVSNFKSSRNNDIKNVVTKPPSKHYNAESQDEDDFQY